MINTKSLEAVSKSRLNSVFVKPAYGSYCFSHIPDTIAKVFGLPAAQPLPVDVLPAWDGFDCVILFYMDAFGWRFFEQFAERSPFLQEMLRNGVVSQMTSMFPSTTSAHATTIHTGMDVNTSGVYEWYYYEPTIGEVISPLTFSLTDRFAHDGLLARGVQPADVFLPQTLYARLAEGGVQSFVSQTRSINRSAYSQFVTRGAKHLPYITLPEVLTNFTEHYEHSSGKRYYMLYFSPIDTICHEYGPESAQVEAEVESMLMQMERFLQRCAKRFKKTLMLITADHGQVDVVPEKTFYLNQHIEGLERFFKRTVTGEPIYFGGSARDMFLYVEDAHLAEVESLLKPKLEGIAEVYRTETLVEHGLFGVSPISTRLAERIGNLVILPYKGESVYWYIKDRFEMPLRGHHGGLTPEEMMIPFIAYASG